MRYLRYKKFMCAFIASAMVVSGLPGTSYSALAEENDTESSETTESDNEKVSGNDADDDEESSAEESLIASIDFDEENLDAEGAKAEAVGSVSYTDDTENGEGHALYLGGSSYLNLTDEDGNSLLSGHDELTISYRSKTEKSSYSWGYFAANDATARAESNLHYIGVLDSTTSVTAERFGSSRTTSLTASTIDEWKNVTVVYEDDTTTLYINGKKKDSATGCISLSEVLGDSSIFQIGKANWGSGEYFKGSIDDIKIYSKALDAETIAKKDILEKDESELVECSANDVTAKGARAGLKITEVSDLDTSDIYIESSESAEELPSKVEVTLSDGTKRDAYVSWTDSDSLEHLTTVSGLSAGKHELTGRLSYYPSPLVSEKADPFIIYNDEDGYYYMTSSWPAYGSINAGYDRIALRRAKTLIGLQDAEDVSGMLERLERKSGVHHVKILAKE